MLKLLICSVFLFSSLALAADESDHIMVRPKEIKWSAGPASLPAGSQVAILFGDPSVEGPFSMRLKFPARYLIPPHFHPQDENVTVISGALLMATGDDARAKTMSLPAGSFARMKAGTHHFARTLRPTIVQINSIGPWGITYVNPADDPRNGN